MDRRICEPCQTHCHQRQLTKQPVCTGPGRHPGKGGCNKCEKFVVQSPFNQMNSEISDLSSPHTTISLLCIRGDCPPGTYLTTEVVQPNTLFAKYAEIFTSVAAVCRSCHPRCPMCTAYSLLRANEQRLGCMKCTGFWLRDACVEHCPIEQTYAIWIKTNHNVSRNSSEKHLNLKDIDLKHNGIYVRHLNGQCLACHEQCHAGCWGPGPDQCNHCLNVKVPIRFISNNLTKVYGLDQFSGDDLSIEMNSLNLHLYHGRFICLPQCPNDLYNHIINIPEMEGETICHHSTYLSTSDYELIMQDNVYPFQYFNNYPFSNNNQQLEQGTSAGIIGLRKSSSYFSSVNGSIMHRKLKNDPVILIMIPLCIILIVFAVLVFICYRYRSNQQYIKKYEHSPLLLLKLLFCPLSFISKRFVSDISNYKYKKGNPVINLSPTNCQYKNRNDESGTETNVMQYPGTEEGLLGRSSVTGSHRYPNQVRCLPILFIESFYSNMKAFLNVRKYEPIDRKLIVNGQKAPNLGRLVMINLDDLCLNEKSGPLGTGAFGAVYQGIWKVCQTDYPNLPNINYVITANNEEELMLKVNSQSSRSLLTTPTPMNEMNVVSTNQINSSNIQANEVHTSATEKSSVINQKNNNTDEDTSQTSNSVTTTSKASTEKSKKEYKLLCVAVKILNEVRGSSDLQALLDEAKNESSSNTEVYSSTGDTRSRATIYPTTRLSGERFRQPDQTVPSFQSMKSRNSCSPLQNSSSSSGLTNRRFDVGRRTRTSLLLPPTVLQANRTGKYPRHKRRSVGARTDYTMSASLSINSGIGERWGNSSFATHSHPTLIKVDEANGTGNISRNFKINSNTSGNNRNNEQFNVGLFSTDSWASSGQPLLSSDQESSLSHLMLSNFGYTSSESRSSMTVNSPGQHNRNFSSTGSSVPTESRNSEQQSVDEPTSNTQRIGLDMRSGLPVNTSFEAAAGYVWPQWPDAIPNPENNNLDQANSSETSYVFNAIDSESENNLPFLNRQLWLRRNARQRRYYLRQLQIHRSVADSSLPEQAGEDAMEETSSWAEPSRSNQSNPNGQQEDSDSDPGSADRYWPDPTYSPQNV
ncbi:unnamed protein product [Schistosoma margrebowiei]|uniref:Uncharacterized protein n=1 Tax=Schistosoma margrebowiei TaxID=48269 RepID=A0A183MVS1_9TREM|nr:unnamed protein product [Schistosoma margrebowiei]